MRSKGKHYYISITQMLIYIKIYIKKLIYIKKVNFYHSLFRSVKVGALRAADKSCI